MKYTAEIWFGNTIMKIELDNTQGVDYDDTLEVAKKIATKLGGDCWHVELEEE